MALVSEQENNDGAAGDAQMAAFAAEKLHYRFVDSSLLERALTHPSYGQKDPAAKSNQRLEFLGDAVLGMVLADWLFRDLPHEREGNLTRYRSALVKGEQLTVLAREIQLGEHLRMGDAEAAHGGRERASILEDAFEAIIGAVYLDGGIEAAAMVIRHLYGDLNKRLETVLYEHNPKGRLQELLQPRIGNDGIEYKIRDETGPDHCKQFAVDVWFDSGCQGTGTGSSKKIAEEAAARDALRALQSDRAT